MCAITKPMLAGKCEQPEELRFPVLATPKLDGIRCLKIGGKALTRSFKPVSNRFIREWIEANLTDGVDGELVVPGATFSETSGHVGRESGEPDFRFAVFDYVSSRTDRPYECRMAQLERLAEWDRVVKVLPMVITNAAQLALYEERCIQEGYEGVMVRDPAGPYKCGRSTQVISQPGIPTIVKDTVGAGDSFTAAFIIGFLRKESLDHVLQKACETASAVCAQSGAVPISVSPAKHC